MIYEILNVLWIALSSIRMKTALVYLGCLVIMASSYILHRMARTQNENYIEIMNHSVRDSNNIFDYNSWNASDDLTNYLVYQFRYDWGDELTMTDDTVSRAEIKSPTVQSYLYLLSETNPEAEIKLLDLLNINKPDLVEPYLMRRYLKPALSDISEEDYYSANRLMSRYFLLHEKYCDDEAICTYNNYYYLCRLLLQDRWALSCNRDDAKDLFAQTYRILGDRSAAVDLKTYDSKHFNEYVSYVEGIGMIGSKYYKAAYLHYSDAIENSSTDLFREYNAFMALRSLFWIFDNDRTKANKDNFDKAMKDYYPFVKSNYLKVDIEYYNNIVQSSELVSI